VRALLS